MIKRKGNTFISEGDIITVKVSVVSGHIEWLVNDIRQESYYMARLQDKDIEWVPYVRMCREGDQISWVE